MTTRDLMNNIHPVRALSPVASAGSDVAWVSEIIDTAGYESLTFLILTGALPDANATFVVLVEHSDDSGMSGAVAVPDNMLIGTETLAAFAFGDDDEVRKIGYVGDKQYVRMTITPANNTGASLYAAVALLAHARDNRPSANPPV
jgi:hypothetical protein